MLNRKTHNPDVLTCLANLSSDERLLAGLEDKFFESYERAFKNSENRLRVKQRREAFNRLSGRLNKFRNFRTISAGNVSKSIARTYEHRKVGK